MDLVNCKKSWLHWQNIFQSLSFYICVQITVALNKLWHIGWPLQLTKSLTLLHKRKEIGFNHSHCCWNQSCFLNICHSYYDNYFLQLTFWRSDFLTFASFTTMQRNTSRIQSVSGQEELIQWACMHCFFEVFSVMYRKHFCILKGNILREDTQQLHI